MFYTEDPVLLVEKLEETRLAFVIEKMPYEKTHRLPERIRVLTRETKLREYDQILFRQGKVTYIITIVPYYP